MPAYVFRGEDQYRRDMMACPPARPPKRVMRQAVTPAMLDVLSAMGDREYTAKEVAGSLGLNSRSVGYLLSRLKEENLVEKARADTKKHATTWRRVDGLS